MSKQLPIFNERAPSHAFMSVLMGGGGPFQECTMCGRTHFALNSPYMEQSELDDFIRLAAEKPDAYIGVDSECIHYSTIQGHAVPDDCPCNGLYKYEKFMWDYKDLWVSYLMARKLEAQNLADSINIPNI